MKKNTLRNRTIYYYRCQFLEHETITVTKNLEQMIIDSWATLDTTSKRTIAGTNGKQLVGMKISADKAKLSYGDKDCTLLSLGMYEAGASANTINKPSVSSTELASETIDAPLDQEYLDGEAFICLFENHLVLSPTDTLTNASTRFTTLGNLSLPGVSRFKASILSIIA